MYSSYIIWDVLSGLELAACGLSPLVVGNEANRYIRRSMDQVKSVVIMARIPGAVGKSVPWPSGTLDLTPDQKLQRFRLPTRVSSGQGSSFLKYLPQQSRHKNCEHDPQFHGRLCKYQLPKLYHLGNPININT